MRVPTLRHGSNVFPVAFARVEQRGQRSTPPVGPDLVHRPGFGSNGRGPVGFPADSVPAWHAPRSDRLAAMSTPARLGNAPACRSELMSFEHRCRAVAGALSSPTSEPPLLMGKATAESPLAFQSLPRLSTVECKTSDQLGSGTLALVPIITAPSRSRGVAEAQCRPRPDRPVCLRRAPQTRPRAGSSRAVERTHGLQLR